MVYCCAIVIINMAAIKNKLKSKNMQERDDYAKDAIFYFIIIALQLIAIAMLFIWLPIPLK